MTWHNDSATPITSTLVLFNRIVDYAVAEGWIERIPREDWVNEAGFTERRCQLEGPGHDVNHRVHIQLRTSHRETNDRWDIQARMVFSYQAAQDFDNQVFKDGALIWARMPVGNENMRTWISTTDTRIITVVEIGGTYQLLYVGFVLTGLPVDDYAYPNVICASYMGSGGITISTSESGNNGIRYDSSSTTLTMGLFSDFSFAVSDVNQLFFRGSSNSYDPVFSYTPTFFTNRTFGVGGVRTLYPILIAVSENNLGISWSYDSCYRVNGEGLTAEDTVTEGGSVFTVFPNINRLTKNSFFALENI